MKLSKFFHGIIVPFPSLIISWECLNNLLSLLTFFANEHGVMEYFVLIPLATINWLLPHGIFVCLSVCLLLVATFHQQQIKFSLYFLLWTQLLISMFSRVFFFFIKRTYTAPSSSMFGDWERNWYATLLICKSVEA